MTTTKLNASIPTNIHAHFRGERSEIREAAKDILKRSATGTQSLAIQIGHEKDSPEYKRSFMNFNWILLCIQGNAKLSDWNTSTRPILLARAKEIGAQEVLNEFVESLEQIFDEQSKSGKRCAKVLNFAEADFFADL